MSKLPLPIKMRRFNYRPIFSLLKNPNNFPKSLNNHLHTFSFNGIPLSPKPHFNFTQFFSNYGSSTSDTPLSPSPQKTRYSLSSSKRHKLARRERRSAPDYEVKKSLDLCSKWGDLERALEVYAQAKKDGIPLNVYHYNILLYLCSLNVANDSINDDNGGGNCRGSGVIDRLEKGFELFKQMGVEKIEPNEATFTNMARIAAAKRDPERAFDLVKEMKRSGVLPKLRSYEPALYGFCEKGDADGAYRVDDHMVECGVVAEEGELRALLKLSVEVGRGDKVYEMMHKLRAEVRQVSVETVKVVREWFLSEAASGVGVEEWDVRKVKEGMVKRGGGGHGQGWLGSGKWKVVQAEMNKEGVCCGCGEKLVCIDIDPRETESFAADLSSLACKNDPRSDFLRFIKWLETHGPFDAVVDGANTGMVKSKTFNHRQLIRVVRQLQDISPSKKLPLVILHRSRVHGQRNKPIENPTATKMFDAWRRAGVLYTTPQGPNDDWYWLYAAVSNKCLVVTNDEMRDHLFQLLGNSIFPRWKEKHQVRMVVSGKGISLHMPPPYSNVIQESEQGSWHIPTVIGDDLETPRQWLCVTRTPKTRSRACLSDLF